MSNTLRGCFVAHPGCTFISIDASQIELRVLAFLSQDQQMLDDLKSGDLHAGTALRMFGMPDTLEAIQALPDNATADEVQSWIKAEFKKSRYKAKQGNFALVYGADEHKMAQLLECSVPEASQFMADHREAYPTLYVWMDSKRAEVKQLGYTTNLFGRIRPLPELKSELWKVREKAEREIINTIVQGTAVDIVKMMGLELRQNLDMTIKFVLQIHDEWILESPDNLVDKVLFQAGELSLSFPDYPVGISIGKSYGNMKKLEAK